MVASVYELWEGREASQSLDARRSDYVRVFEVRTTSPFDGPTVAAGAGAIALGLPIITQAHPEDANAYVYRVRPVQSSDDPTLWRVTVDYSTQIGGPNSPGGSDAAADPTDVPENPLLRPPVVRMSFQQTQEVVRKDVDGNPVENSAGFPFDPPVMVEVSRPIMTVTVNRASFSLPAAADLQDSVNSTTWQTLAPRVARCVGIDADTAYENGVSYWQISYQFALKADTWDVQVLDAGYTERVYGDEVGGGATKLRRIVDEHGREASEPVPLNGGGGRLLAGDPPVFLTFRVYRERDFNTLVV